MALIIVVVIAAFTSKANAGSANYNAVKRAVCHYFRGSLCWQAMSVVGCETGHTYSIWAKNGQYLGLWQMGLHERETYGYGNNAWAQSKGARAYFRVSGWSPWQCMPGGGLRW